MPENTTMNGKIYLTKAQNVISYGIDAVILDEFICYTVELWVIYL